MAAHDGASSSRFSSTYDVFLSFRGEDTRNNFIGFLHYALEREGINVFIDSKGLWGGEEIKTALLDAIQQSKISIPIFSKGYADSKWCLMELVEIIRCHRFNGQKVLPIFLDVEPRDVRHQTGSFEGSFQTHMEKYDAQKIQNWRDALTEAAGKKGYELKDVKGNQPELVKLIVDWAMSELSSNSNHLSDVTNPVGLDARVEDVLSQLKVDLNDVRFVGICGIGGMGKTTIATSLYNQIFEKFDMSCFLANVREEASSGPNGVVSLQQKLIYSVSEKDEKICIVQRGKQLIKEKLKGKKVLLILDDVDSDSQLKDLAIDSISFGPGSRIIITTRNEHILNAAKVDGVNIYWPKELDDEQSIQLFSLHAFSSDRPPEEYLQLSLDVIHLARGLPLTLEVLGSTFSDKDNREEEVWKSMLAELKKIPHDDVYKKLKISYDKLNDNEKSIFLDAACFLVGWNKKYVIQLWDACGFESILAIKKLTQRSLLKFIPNPFSHYNELRMHDQIQAMGRRIVYEENPKEPSKRSRIWSDKEFLEVIEEPEGPQTLEVIFSTILEFEYMCDSIPLPLPYCRNFAMMSKLRVLNIDAVQAEGKFPHLPPNLRWLTWKGLIVPANFYHKKLVHMNLSRSQIREAWINKPQNKNERFQKLKVLNLQHCEVSHESLDFSWFPYLETLDLRNCRNMVNLHKSIGDLKSLVELELRETKIEELPNSICSLSSLKVLNLNMCTSLKNLPESIGDLKSLVELDLEGTKIENIPSTICKLSGLEYLNLSGCSSLKNLPESIGDMKSLVKLDLEWTKIEEIPSSICKLSGLEYLNLSVCSSLKNLPESIGDMKSLVKLDLEGIKIEEIPSSICKLSCLQHLYLSGCSSLKNLPESIGDMKSLVKLDLEETKIEEIPSSICKLSGLEHLNLNRCSSLKNLPESIGDMKSLVKLDLEGTKIEEIPSSIGKLSCLQHLYLSGCSSLKNLPDSIGDLKSLAELALKKTKIWEIPSSICKLSCLKYLDLSGCSSLKNLPDSIGDLKSLVKFDLDRTRIEEIPSSICKLSCLKYLNLSECLSLKSLPDSIGDLKSLVKLDLKGTKEIEEIPSSICKLSCLQYLNLSECSSLKNLPESIWDLESLNELLVINCKTLTDTPKWKIHGEGTLLVDEMSRGIYNYSLLNVNDEIDKGLILCLVFYLRDHVEERQLVDISLSIKFSIRRKHRRIHCGDDKMVIAEGVEYTARKRHVIYVHHFKGFDWFGIPLKPGIDVIEAIQVFWNIESRYLIWSGKPKFWKVLLESTTSEQQQQITNQEEEESITTAARRMTADFFNWSDDEDHERSHHFVPTQQVGSSTHKTIHHFISSSNALENEGSNPVVTQQADEESSNEMIDSHNDLRLGLGLGVGLPMIDSQCDLELRLGLTDQGGGQAGRVAEDPNLSQQALGLLPERLWRAVKRARLDMDDAGPTGAL